LASSSSWTVKARELLKVHLKVRIGNAFRFFPSFREQESLLQILVIWVSFAQVVITQFSKEFFSTPLSKKQKVALGAIL
jgi:hypothetical protein